MPDGDRTGQGKHGQNHCLAHGQALRQENGPVQVPAVGEHACHRGQEETGDLAAKADQPQQERRVAQPVNEPDHGHLLHPGADQGNTLPEEEQAEVAVFQGPKQDALLRHDVWWTISRSASGPCIIRAASRTINRVPFDGGQGRRIHRSDLGPE